jgi:hypothetical protein
MTREGIEILAVQGKIDLGESFSYGPFFVYENKNKERKIIILN